MERIVLLDNRLQFVWQSGQSKLHMLVMNGHLRDARVCCGLLFDPESGRKTAFNKHIPWLTSEDVCMKCVARARKRVPTAFMTMPYTDADRLQDEAEATAILQAAFYNQPTDR